LNISDSTTYKG